MESDLSSSASFIEAAPNRAQHLHNVTCAYCGCPITDANRTREHVIGRRFVPKGTLNGLWNLILNACQPCNSRKSDLEDDISAITLHMGGWRGLGYDEAALAQEAQRKTINARSRRTHKLVGDSDEHLKLNADAGALKLSFSFVSPPQIDQERAFELARLHLSAIFYMQTFNSQTRTGGFWLHGFHPVAAAIRSDWGNPTMRGFMAETRDWDVRFIAVAADGFFKVTTRKHPTADTWSWAVEWNHVYRTVGFFGDRLPAQQVVNRFPQPVMRSVYQGPDSSLSFRIDEKLPDTDDTLFIVPPAPQADAEVPPS